MEAKVYAGTSGYSYTSWKPEFYPKSLPSTRFLEYYASRLNLVEVNYTFRQLAKSATFEKWLSATPNDFRYAPKAHNKITHILRLCNAEEFTQVFLNTLEPFRSQDKLGPILLQLPPSLKADTDCLQQYVKSLPAAYRFAFEFRHESWFDERVMSILREHNIGLCIAESEKLETPEVTTSDFVYFRLRKPNYSDSEINALAKKIAGYRDQGFTVYALFKHEESPAGAFCAEKLLQLTQAPEAEHLK